MNDWSIGRSIAPPDDGNVSMPMPSEQEKQDIVEFLGRNKPGPKPKPKQDFKEIVVRIPPDMMARINHAIEMKRFTNRSDLVREALLQFFHPVVMSPNTGNITATTFNNGESPIEYSSNISYSSSLSIGRLMFDTTHRPGFIRRKLLKWLLGVTVNDR